MKKCNNLQYYTTIAFIEMLHVTNENKITKHKILDAITNSSLKNMLDIEIIHKLEIELEKYTLKYDNKKLKIDNEKTQRKNKECVLNSSTEDIYKSIHSIL